MRVGQEVQEVPRRLARLTAVEGIVLSGLEKTFKSPQGPVRAVRGIDVSISLGETVAFLGPNGAGKSTTIDMLLGLLPPDKGTVDALRQAARRGDRIGSDRRDAADRRADPRSLGARARHDDGVALSGVRSTVDEMLELTGIADIAERRTQKLSGGQTQRVRFAVALVSNPDLLVLDEPTVAMDVEGRHAFWTTMRGFAARGKTVLFATHYLEEADAYADRAILMANGRVVADGPTNEIKAMVGVRTIRATLPDADLEELRTAPRCQGASSGAASR